MRCPRFTVACGEDNQSGQMIGEASAHGTTLLGGTLCLPDGSPFTRLERSPNPPLLEKLDSLLIRNADESAARLVTILSGEDQGLDRETLLLNAALAGWTHGAAASLEEALAQCTEALDSGKALERLKAWQEFSK
jgi:anthranilate phosphoribosyltransferase